jgi:hypothetical protein
VGETSTDEETLGEAAEYYSWLYRTKEVSTHALEHCVRLLEQKQVPNKAAKGVEKAITESEVRACIRKMAKGKAPGTDSLPAEFYATFEYLIVPELTEVLNAALDAGTSLASRSIQTECGKAL